MTSAADLRRKDSPRTGREKRRRFTIADAMIIVAASAVGMAWHRVFFGVLHSNVGETYTVVDEVHPLLAAWTLGYFAIRLRRPRPTRRRLMTQPGMAACSSVVLFVAIVMPMLSLINLLNGNSGVGTLLLNVPEALLTLLQLGGIAVPLSWAQLVIGARWHREPGWIDWLGILLGLGWMLLSFTFLFQVL